MRPQGNNDVLVNKATGNTVKTASALTPAAIDSRMSDAAWKEIRYLEISSPTGAYVSLFIEAYVRIPDKNAVYDSYLEFKTSSGTIKLEGKTLTFENDISNILVKAGFQVSTGVSSTLRRLATAHQLMGLFNSISAADLKDWPGMDPLPKIPTTFHATFQMGYSCESHTGDRCRNCKCEARESFSFKREGVGMKAELTDIVVHTFSSQMLSGTDSRPAGLAASGTPTCLRGRSKQTFRGSY